jgi:hypothetical protein
VPVPAGGRLESESDYACASDGDIFTGTERSTGGRSEGEGEEGPRPQNEVASRRSKSADRRRFRQRCGAPAADLLAADAIATCGPGSFACTYAIASTRNA